VTAALGAGEEPALSAEGHAAQRSFGAVVRQADPAVLQEPSEARPVIRRQQVVDRLGDLGVFRQQRPLGAQPGLQPLDERCREALARGKAGSGVVTIDLALDVEQRSSATARS
jgi:hypothetical protein